MSSPARQQAEPKLEALKTRSPQTANPAASTALAGILRGFVRIILPCYALLGATAVLTYWMFS